jgi:simple sugar transport system substrate-binding protein
MRYLLMCSALTLGALIGLHFLDEPEHPFPFEGRHVIVLSGGRSEDSFRRAVEEGAVRAERDLGCRISIASTNWNSSVAVTRFQEAMSGAPDGICLIGEPGNAQLLSLIESAIEGEISVTSYQRPMPEAQERFSTMGYGFAGPDFFRAGEDLVNAAVKKHQLARGDLVLLVHDPAFKDEDGLYGGTAAAIQSHGLTAEMVEIALNRTESISETLDLFLKNTGARGAEPNLIFSLNVPLDICLYSLSRSRFKPDQLPLVGVDVGGEMMTVLRDGQSHLSLLLQQDVSLQVYLAIFQACMNREYAAVGPRIFTPHAVVDRSMLVKLPQIQSTNFIQRF